MIRKLFSVYSERSRKKRGKIFRDILQPNEASSILDLGGGDGHHIRGIIEFSKNVTVADILAKDLKVAREKYGFKTVQLEENENLPFKDKEFDIVFSNSVIEHVTLPKDKIWDHKNGLTFKKLSLQRQRHFADEIRRIGKGYYVQTPYRYFIMESHTWLPGLIVLLPRPALIALLRITNRFWAKKSDPDWNLLTVKELQAMFPEAEIRREKSLGFTKSIMAIKRPNP